MKHSAIDVFWLSLYFWENENILSNQANIFEAEISSADLESEDFTYSIKWIQRIQSMSVRMGIPEFQKLTSSLKDQGFFWQNYIDAPASLFSTFSTVKLVK